MITDIFWTDGDIQLDASGNFKLANDNDVIKQDLIARLRTVNGSHWAYVDEGAGLDGAVMAGISQFQMLELQQNCNVEAFKHPFVYSVVTTPLIETGRDTVKISLNIELLSDEQLQLVLE
jgi:hypothetical protein